MALKMNDNQVEDLKSLMRACSYPFTAIQKESEKDLVWAPYIREKADLLIRYASHIKQLAEDAIEEENQ